jgi:hypothetical protein
MSLEAVAPHWDSVVRDREWLAVEQRTRTAVLSGAGVARARTVELEAPSWARGLAELDREPAGAEPGPGRGTRRPGQGPFQNRRSSARSQASLRKEEAPRPAPQPHAETKKTSCHA